MLQELERLNVSVNAMRTDLATDKQAHATDISDLRTEIALLKLRNTIYGGISGTIFGALAAGVVAAIMQR